jgi:hypothetical protein
MIALFSIIPLIPCIVNLSFSLWIAYCFRRYPKPPLWSIFCLLALGIGTIRLLFLIGISPFSLLVFTVLTAILCVVQALALICQRCLGSSRRMSWSIATMVVLPIAVWTDLRFRITVEEVDGTPVEVDVKRFHFHHPPRSYFQSFDYGYGNRLKKGVVYFGFCQWVKHREEWSIFGDACAPGGGRIRGSLALTDGAWQKWPMRVTVVPAVP